MDLKVQDVRHSSLRDSSFSQDLYSVNNPQYVNFTRSSPSGGFVEVEAFAKINLFLSITGKRSDGYHELVSVMQSVGLCDTLQISIAPAQAEQIILETDHPNLPTDGSNLIVKAAKLLVCEYGISESINIKLQKQIPMGAGLGGGSSNAAATLHGLNHLLELGITPEKLMQMGKTLGADVPFCLLGKSALAKGIGEILTPLPPHPPCHIVLACPPIHISTAETFGRLKDFNPPSVESFLQSYYTSDISKIAETFFNTFTPITAGLHPIISTLITSLQAHGALGASMTGTGSTVFGYFNNENDARRVCNILKHHHPDIKFFSTTI